MATPEEPAENLSWCTAEVAGDLTGKTIDVLTRNIAAMAVELHTGLIESVPREDMTRRDRYWLRQAVAFQAAWLLTQPDYLDRLAVRGIQQEGQSAEAGNPDWLTLAPLARKALRKLSWRSGMRSIDTSYEARRLRLDPLLEVMDDYQTWRPI